jgi:hypothetical protein
MVLAAIGICGAAEWIEERIGMPSGGQRPAFGRIDPVVWFPAAAILIVAMLFLFGGFPPLGIGLVALAAILVLADARINRPPVQSSAQSARSAARSSRSAGPPPRLAGSARRAGTTQSVQSSRSGSPERRTSSGRPPARRTEGSQRRDIR